MQRIIEIESDSFEEPWKEDDFLYFRNRTNSMIDIADYHKEVVGYICYELHEDGISLVNIAVSRNLRRRSIGSQMIQFLIRFLKSKKLKYIDFRIRETNLRAQLFFSKCGFRGVRVLRNYFEDTGEDAFLMEYLRFSSNRISFGQDVPW